MRCTLALIAISAAVALTVTACSSSPPPQMTVNGTVEVAVTDYSEFQADYPQITNDTAQVTVTNPSGTVIAVTTADNGNVAQGPSRAGRHDPDDRLHGEGPGGLVVLRDHCLRGERDAALHPAADAAGARAVRRRRLLRLIRKTGAVLRSSTPRPQRRPRQLAEGDCYRFLEINC